MEPINSSDYQCPICYGVFVEPVKLPCKHYFCFTCLENLQDFEMDGWKCPMCRALVPEMFELVVDQNKADQAKKTLPADYDTRKKQLAEEKKLQENKIKLRFRYGNTHSTKETKESNKHEWAIYFRCENSKIDMQKIIKKVTFELHPTFRNPIVNISKPPYEFKAVGWGYFDIPITITWLEHVGMPPTKFNHSLCFDRPDTYKGLRVSIDKAVLNIKQWAMILVQS